MEATTRRQLFGAGAGLATIWGISAAEAEANPARMKAFVTELRPIGVSMRHWPSSPELEQRLTAAISDRNVELDAYARARAVWLVGKADATHHTRFEVPFEEMVILEYMMRHGYLGATVVEASVTDDDGSELPNAYYYTPAMYQKADEANADKGEPEYLPFWLKAQIGAMAAARKREELSGQDDPHASLQVGRDSPEELVLRRAAGQGLLWVTDTSLIRDSRTYRISHAGFWAAHWRGWCTLKMPDGGGLSLPADTPEQKLSRFLIRD